jgi:hypothetical protein
LASKFLAEKFLLSPSKIFFSKQSSNLISTNWVKLKYHRVPDERSLVIIQGQGKEWPAFPVRHTFKFGVEKFENWLQMGQC